MPLRLWVHRCCCLPLLRLIACSMRQLATHHALHVGMLCR